jgi:NDP-sugar pyrophosphorylase family protein
VHIVVLAGGLGTRLGPPSDQMPKSLTPLGGELFVEYRLKLFGPNGKESQECS